MADIVRRWLVEASLAFLNIPFLIPFALPIFPLVLAGFMSGSADLVSLRTQGRQTLLENHILKSSSGGMRARPSSP